MLTHEAVMTISSPTQTSTFDDSSSSTASVDTPTSSSSSKKNKKKKKTKAVKMQEKLEDRRSADENPSELPLARRLEKAADLPDTHAALLGLLGWSHLYMHTETVLCFFQSDALTLLLSNVLRSQSAAPVLDNLEALLANCLSVESSSEAAGVAPHRRMAGVVVAAVKAIADQMQDSADDVDDVHTEAERVAQSLSRLVCAHMLSLHGVDLDSPLAKDSQNLHCVEAKIAQVTKADDAVRGQTIRESFQRRDLRSDALTLHETRLKKLTKLVEERVRDLEQQQEVQDEVEEEEEKACLKENTPTTQDETMMQEVAQALQDMQDRRDEELAPLRKKQVESSTETQSLRQKEEELEAQLRTVKRELQRVVGEQQETDDEIRVVEERFIADTTRFRAEHQHVTRRFSRALRRRVITTELGRVQNEVRQAGLAHSQIHILRAKQTACISQELEASLKYFQSELHCVKFMMSRVEETETNLALLRSEAASCRTSGVSTVGEEIKVKVFELTAHLEEDRNCLSALRKRDEELLGSMRRILTDPSLRDALADVDKKIKHESQRMIDYVSKLYEESDNKLAEEISGDTEGKEAINSNKK